MEEQTKIAPVYGRRVVERAGSKLEGKHPDWLVQHPLACGWLWTLFWALLLIPADHFRLRAHIPTLFVVLWAIFIVLGALPSFAATVACLSQTPHSHLRREESVLSHFFARFASYVLGFVLWTASVILSASIALSLHAAAGNNPAKTIDAGFAYLAASVPIAVVILWFVLIVRYSWFLSRLRGWRALPKSNRIPRTFLAKSPRTKTVIIGLAHPGLLLVSGTLGTLLTLLLVIDDVTLRILH
jgi:hypothetical protein